MVFWKPKDFFINILISKIVMYFPPNSLCSHVLNKKIMLTINFVNRNSPFIESMQLASNNMLCIFVRSDKILANPFHVYNALYPWYTVLTFKVVYPYWILLTRSAECLQSFSISSLRFNRIYVLCTMTVRPEPSSTTDQNVGQHDLTKTLLRPNLTVKRSL